MIYYTNSEKETESVGYNIAKKLHTGGIETAFIALGGEMGVGKTAFVRGFASYFDISGVRSPTYTVVNEYSHGKVRIFHFDMYRISSEDDLYSIGFYDYFDRNGICLVEWSENIEYALPDTYLRAEIKKCSTADTDKREIYLTLM